MSEVVAHEPESVLCQQFRMGKHISSQCLRGINFADCGAARLAIDSREPQQGLL